MSSAAEVEVFFDDTPGETRGVVRQSDGYAALYIERDGDPEAQKLGARSVVRVTEINPGLHGAFVELPDGTTGFLPTAGGERFSTGQALEAVVTAEPRAGKSAVLKKTGAGQGAPRLLESAPSLVERLQAFAPREDWFTGITAIDAVLEAEEEALARTHRFPGAGLDLSIERTRALVAVDIDFAAASGRNPQQARARANAEGLRQAARLVRLKGWAGLVVIDVVGDGRDGDALLKVARSAFSYERQAVFGPVSRFGLMQLTLPWSRTPVEERLAASSHTRAQTLVRALRRDLLSDTATPVLTGRCCPEEAEIAAPLAARLGPRARIVADPAIQPGRAFIEGS